MKNIVKITAVLSWFNLVIGSLLVLIGLLTGLASGNMTYLLGSVLFSSAIILHSYAALQLRKSVVYPDIPLSRQTPAGIRFIGFVALFFAYMNMIHSFPLLQHSNDFVKQIKLPPGSPNINLTNIVKGVGIFSLLFSITIALNVTLNFRLLRWYVIQTKNEEGR